MSIPNGEFVKAGLRYLAMDEAGQAKAKSEARPEIFERVEAEAAAVQWVLLACLVWHEQGVLDDVLAHVRTECGGQTSLDVAA